MTADGRSGPGGPAARGPVPAPALAADAPAGAGTDRAAAAFGRLVAVMDRLRSPGGCPWDAEQTHSSLVPYALEEVHELAEAVDAGDRDGLREELGDVLLQVVFHARVAQDDPADPFDVAEVAERLVAKLVRRHPHVFGEPADDLAAGDLAPGDVHRRWDDAKRAEKPARASALDGVPASLGALARTQKVAGKAVRAGLLALPAGPDEDGPVVPDDAGPRADASSAGAPAEAVPSPEPQDVPDVDAAVTAVTGPEDAHGDERDSALGARLLALVLEAERTGVDAEGALRRAGAAWEVGLRAAERADARGEAAPWA
ncbi:nucleoside triphosphate pyrophosphohydrolase [Cellulomonas sp. JZ18]|uniref:MazG nucleotide pyrophosphohydrolase domain-containing protein n=1 Tax=Cellulomonas sp. JZ18 TaxID=2654191 RepID=UPI0012D4BF0C|nr:MazG nucleotide pyrophosphohydrolase domain-containing protein [Cellulomonas sp. JZ18]QGQ20142.1 nucleoside triphosphate pyrophosphohydrolase [Cellulomonas sp. JZ18]